MKKSLFLPLFLLLLLGHNAAGQYISGAMRFSNPIVEKDSNTLSLSYNNLFYFRDYEYFNTVQTGYTLFGTWQYPRIAYQPNKELKMEAGILLQKEFGDKKLNKAWPVFSIQLQKKNIRFLFGVLEKDYSHQLIIPLMQYDQVIERPIEEGFQFKVNKKRFQSDFWLDWELRQGLDANFSEELTGGLSVSATLTDPQKPFQVKIPVQFLLPHQGGQLDTNSSLVSTVINYSTGLQTEWNNPAATHWLKQAKAETFYTGYYHSLSHLTYPYNKGWGWMSNLFLKTKWDFFFLATYWSGHHFIAPKGEKLLQSISSFSSDPNSIRPERKLLFLTLGYTSELFSDFFVDFRYTPYFDLLNGRQHLEKSYLILLSYRKNFILATLKNKTRM